MGCVLELRTVAEVLTIRSPLLLDEQELTVASEWKLACHFDVAKRASGPSW